MSELRRPLARSRGRIVGAVWQHPRMSSLNWRTVAELRLASPVVPNPNSTSELMANLYNVNVAIEGGLIHIDPRQQPANQRQEYEVSVVPTSSVEYIRYVEMPRPSGTTVLR